MTMISEKYRIAVYYKKGTQSMHCVTTQQTVQCNLGLAPSHTHNGKSVTIHAHTPYSEGL